MDLGAKGDCTVDRVRDASVVLGGASHRGCARRPLATVGLVVNVQWLFDRRSRFPVAPLGSGQHPCEFKGVVVGVTPVHGLGGPVVGGAVEASFGDEAVVPLCEVL